MTLHLTVCMDSGFKIHPQAGLEANLRAVGSGGGSGLLAGGDLPEMLSCVCRKSSKIVFI